MSAFAAAGCKWETAAVTAPANGNFGDRVLRALARGTAIPAVFVDRDITVRWVSESIEDVSGHAPATLLGTNALDLIHPDDLKPLTDLILGEIANPVAYGANGDPARTALNVARIRHADGTFHLYEMAATNLLGAEDIDGFLLLLRIASERFYLDQAYRDLAVGQPAATVFASLVELLEHQVRGARVAISCEAGATSLVIPADVFAEMVAAGERSRPLGDERVWLIPIESGGELLGHTTLIGALPPETSRWTAVVIGRVHDQVAVTVARDRSARALQSLAESDPLTGLDNRRTFFGRVNEAHRTSRDPSAAILYLDLDGFKAINDDAGHLVGDAILVTIAERMRREVRSADSLARLGGDEFTLLVRGLPSVDEVVALTDRLLSAIREPIEVEDDTWVVGASIGVAFARDSNRIDELLAAADAALRQAKRGGKGCYRIAALDDAPSD